MNILSTLILGLIGSSLASGLDFELQAAGAVTGFPGYTTSLVVYSTVTEGEASKSWTVMEVTGLPDGATTRWPSHETGRHWGIVSTELLHIAVPNDALGEYSLEITWTHSGVARAVNYLLTVVELKAVINPPLVPGIPLDLFGANMEEYGAQHCDEETIERLGVSSQGLVHYDGLRVYNQIADYTGDDRWRECGSWVKEAYLKYIEATTGRLQVWLYFPRGLYEDYRRTGDVRSRDAVLLMAEDKLNWWGRGNVRPESSRPTAYYVSVMYYARLLGGISDPVKLADQYQIAAEHVLSHLIQWVQVTMAGTSGPVATYYLPFQVGLSLEAAIEHYNDTLDPRVPVLVKSILDDMWGYWNADSGSFPYRTDETGVTYPGLNMLIAPAYAWYYAKSGNEIYREHADEIWSAGVNKAWLGGGKQFSQHHRWFSDYLSWREAEVD